MIGSVLFFGTRCSFADIVLSRIADAGFTVAARVVPGNPDSPQPITVLQPRSSSITGERLPLAGNTNAGGSNELGRLCPTVAVNRHRSPATAAYLSDLSADITVVCCYPRRLPMALVNASTNGGMNIHPSLLPAYRGPEPLFWIYRNGEPESGVTLHQVDALLDAGPIVSQQRIDVPIGKTGNELWIDSARLGAEMLIDALERNVLSDAPQPVQGASYQSWPAPDDLVIVPGKWEAWQVYHFCRGVIPLGYLPTLRTGRVSRPVVAAVDYVNDTPKRGALALDAEDKSWIRCKSGYVKLILGVSRNMG